MNWEEYLENRKEGMIIKEIPFERAVKIEDSFYAIPVKSNESILLMLDFYTLTKLHWKAEKNNSDIVTWLIFQQVEGGYQDITSEWLSSLEDIRKFLRKKNYLAR